MTTTKTTKTPTVEFDTTDYECSHGTRPRGRCGSLGWIFADSQDQLTPVFQGTYTEAKKQARAWAIEHGVSLLYVCA